MGKKKEDQEEELIMVGDGAEDLEDQDEEEIESRDSDEGEDEEDEPKKPKVKKKTKDENDEDESDSDEEDERVGHGEDDEADSEGGKEKRESRKARRERQRRARERNELELNFLRTRNDSLERKINEIEERQTRTEVSSIDGRIGQIQSQLKVADQVLARAYEQGTGEDVVEATNIRDKLRENLTRLSSVKSEMSSRTKTEDPVDSRLVFHAQSWLSKNEWYDPQGRDPDSRVVAAIDSRLAQEGFNPGTPEYWDELTERTKRRLPHRFKNDRRLAESEDDDDGEEQDTRRPKGKERRASGPRFSAGGRERPLRKNEVYVSPERRQAMIDAGAWDDPVLRKKLLKRYAEYDRENRGQRR